jgi:hypothetical protein
MKRLYARLYAGLLVWLEHHQPCAGAIKLPHRTVVTDSMRQGQVMWRMTNLQAQEEAAPKSGPARRQSDV